MTFAPVSWALVGLGAGGRVFHAPLLRAAEGVELAVAVGSPRHTGEPVLRGIPLVSSLQEAVEAGAEAVTITTPAGTHEELAHAALDLGLHVVVDKPFALTRAGAQGLVEHAAERGLCLSAFQNRRWDGDFLTLHEVVAAGELGEVERFYNRIQRFHPALPAWNVAAPASVGGGTLVDLGPHLVDQALVLSGPVESVFAELRRSGGGAGAENDVLLLLRHVSGATSVIEASVAAATQAHRLQVNGSLGGLVIDGFDRQEEDLFAGRFPEQLGARWGREDAERTARITTAEGVREIPLRAGAWTEYYPQMARAIRGADVVPVDAEGAVRTAAVIDAARESARSERRVTVAAV